MATAWYRGIRGQYHDSAERRQFRERQVSNTPKVLKSLKVLKKLALSFARGFGQKQQKLRVLA
jgi:hypothetical protein